MPRAIPGAFSTDTNLKDNPEDGSIIYRDIDGSDTQGELTGKPDGKIDDDDRMVIGNPHPRLQGGMTNLFTWKRFELNWVIHLPIISMCTMLPGPTGGTHQHLQKPMEAPTRCGICSTAGRNRVILRMCPKQQFSNQNTIKCQVGLFMMLPISV